MNTQVVLLFQLTMKSSKIISKRRKHPCCFLSSYLWKIWRFPFIKSNLKIKKDLIIINIRWNWDHKIIKSSKNYTPTRNKLILQLFLIIQFFLSPSFPQLSSFVINKIWLISIAKNQFLLFLSNFPKIKKII